MNSVWSLKSILLCWFCCWRLMVFGVCRGCNVYACMWGRYSDEAYERLERSLFPFSMLLSIWKTWLRLGKMMKYSAPSMNQWVSFFFFFNLLAAFILERSSDVIVVYLWTCSTSQLKWWKRLLLPLIQLVTSFTLIYGNYYLLQDFFHNPSMASLHLFAKRWTFMSIIQLVFPLMCCIWRWIRVKQRPIIFVHLCLRWI